MFPMVRWNEDRHVYVAINQAIDRLHFLPVTSNGDIWRRYAYRAELLENIDWANHPSIGLLFRNVPTSNFSG